MACSRPPAQIAGAASFRVSGIERKGILLDPPLSGCAIIPAVRSADDDIAGNIQRP